MRCNRKVEMADASARGRTEKRELYERHILKVLKEAPGSVNQHRVWGATAEGRRPL